jgi:hypothetical protein
MHQTQLEYKKFQTKKENNKMQMKKYIYLCVYIYIHIDIDIKNMGSFKRRMIRYYVRMY